MDKFTHKSFESHNSLRREPSRSNDVPSSITAKEQVALTLINNGKLKQAEIIYRELIEEGSKSHVIYGNLGALLKKKGDIRDSIVLLKKAIQLNPNYPEAHYNLGIALKAQGDLEQAFASTFKSLQIRPDYLDALLNLCNMYQVGDLETLKYMSRRAFNYNQNILNDLRFIQAISSLGKDFAKSIISTKSSDG